MTCSCRDKPLSFAFLESATIALMTADSASSRSALTGIDPSSRSLVDDRLTTFFAVRSSVVALARVSWAEGAVVACVASSALLAMVRMALIALPTVA